MIGQAAPAVGESQAPTQVPQLLLNAKRLGAPYLWPGHDPYATVLQKAEPDHLDMVISRGRVLLDGGRIVTVDDPSSSWDRSRVRCPAIIRYSLRTSTAVAGA